MPRDVIRTIVLATITVTVLNLLTQVEKLTAMSSMEKIGAGMQKAPAVIWYVNTAVLVSESSSWNVNE